MSSTSDRTDQPPQKKALDWHDIVIRTVVPGLLIALTGYVSEWTITNISSKQENARLLTQLQIERERAESDLRKDVFDRAVSSLLDQDQPSRTHLGLSDRLLTLEMLALNFGDSLSLAPLFVEFENDLANATRIEGDADHDIRVGNLRKRLRSLARRVASAQVSALGQHGKVQELLAFEIPLGRPSAEYVWPEDELAMADLDVRAARLGLLDWKDHPGDPCKEAVLEQQAQDELRELRCDFKVVEDRSTIELLGTSHSFRVVFSDADATDRSVKVDLKICEAGKSEDACKRPDFRLDFFNFPKIDNTRLAGNMRFGIVLESFDHIPASDSESGLDAALLQVVLLLLPAEYASLKEPPSMNEALHMLNRVLDVDE